MVNKLILGTVQMGIPYGINNFTGKISSAEAFNILNEAHNSGIRFLDTAEAYGSSMDEIGDFHKKSKKHFNIINKFNGKEVNEITLRNRLKVMDIESYYAYLFHDFNSLKKPVMQELTIQKSKGIINKIGVSVYTNEQFKKAIHITEIDIIQFPFNILDNSTIRSSLIHLAKKNNKELHVRSVFLQGLFFMPIDTLPLKLLPLKPYLLKLYDLVNKYKTTINEMALQYALSFEDIDFVLIGVDNLEQLEKNIRFSKNRLDPYLKDEINRIIVKEIDLINPSNWNIN